MTVEELKKYKKILILGYGKEGKSTEEFLKKNVPGQEIGIADISQGPDYLDKQIDYDLVIKTPGIQKEKITKPYTTATNIFFANKGNHKVIGITGSKGKSTTSSLIYHILRYAKKKVRLVGNIGVPALAELLHPIEDETVFVYELSSYQLDDIAYSPWISVVVSLFPEHMNYHGSESAYYNAKKNIISHATSNDYYVYNAEVPQLQAWADASSAQAIPFETDFEPSQISLLGEHNKANIRGAITVARLLHIPDALSEEAIQSFSPLPHRLECIGIFKDITFYDDAISTSPESTIAALDSLHPVSTLFLGGEDRGYSFTRLIEKIREKKISHLVLFPDTGKNILQELQKSGLPMPDVLETRSMEEAVTYAFTVTPKGTICLLSTASPSYSLWKNFEEKGNEFQLFVSRYGNE